MITQLCLSANQSIQVFGHKSVLVIDSEQSTIVPPECIYFPPLEGERLRAYLNHSFVHFKGPFLHASLRLLGGGCVQSVQGFVKTRAQNKFWHILQSKSKEEGMTESFLSLVVDYPEILHSEDSRGRPPLQAVLEEPIALWKLELLLQAGINVHYSDTTTVLIEVCRNQQCGLETIVEKLIALGIDVNRQNSDMDSALHLVAGNREMKEVIRLLLRKGANPKLVNLLGEMPISIALKNGLLEQADMMINPLPAVCQSYVVGIEEDIQRMIENGADVNACDLEGNSALHKAAPQSWMINVVQLLLSQKAELNGVNKEEKTPLKLVLEQPSSDRLREIAALLVDDGAKGADITTTEVVKADRVTQLSIDVTRSTLHLPPISPHSQSFAAGVATPKMLINVEDAFG